MRLAVILIASALYAAEAPKPEPPKSTVEQQLAAKDAQIEWLTKRLAIVEARAKAMADYFTADTALRNSDANKPAETKEPKITAK